MTRKTGNNIPAKRKVMIFKGIAIAMPLLIIVLLELCLRFFGYGYNTSLFIKDTDPNYWVMNPYASVKYFGDTVNARRGNTERFLVDKSPNTIRIFVLGESTTIGYPYFHNGSFHRWLQYRLMHMYPDKNFEIINVALTAVNSYTVLDFGKQLQFYKPDAVLIYVGHNEYYGALGIGSTSYIGSNYYLVQTLLKLREFRTVQLINNAISSVKNVFSGKITDERENLMKRMASRQDIRFGSSNYEAGINQFKRNMTELCGTLNQQKIPVFLSTVVSNEKDQEPFISDSSKQSAIKYFNQAQREFKQGDFIAAKSNFIKAKEYDLLRFRAPEAINSVITELTQLYPYVHLVDTRKVFEQYSPHHILGNETILEHIHPNLYGYALMSEAFYQSIMQQQLINDKPVTMMSFDELLARMPVTPLDSLNGAYQIMMLKAGWPFNRPIPQDFKIGDTPEERLAGKLSVNHIEWMTAMDQLFRYYISINNKPLALKTAEGMSLEEPENPAFYYYAANLNAGLNNYHEAAYYFKKYFLLIPNQENQKSLYFIYLKAGEPAEALKYLTDDIYGEKTDSARQALLKALKK